jgi:hypothetical protein
VWHFFWKFLGTQNDWVHFAGRAARIWEGEKGRGEKGGVVRDGRWEAGGGSTSLHQRRRAAGAERSGCEPLFCPNVVCSPYLTCFGHPRHCIDDGLMVSDGI